MSYKILTANGVNNSNIDGARNYNFNSGRRNGIVKGALNECNFFASSSNIIALDTGELRICGHRIVIDNIESFSMSNTPSSPQRLSLIAQVVVDESENVSFSLFVQNSSTQLIQNNLDKDGTGTYQLEIGRFTQNTTSIIEDVVRTVDIITGGGNGTASENYINIGDVTTTTISQGMQANVDIENIEVEGKMQTNFSFEIPTASGTTISVAGEEQENVDFTSDPQIQIDNKPGLIVTDAETGSVGEIFNDLTKNKATGFNSHAEGYGTTASGTYSHAEGYGTTASGFNSHAEGFGTTASGFYSHAEGCSVASGKFSHASGDSTIADKEAQTAVGKYNKKGQTGALFSVGNGTETARSTAFEVFQDGHVEVSGGTITYDASTDTFTI